MIESKLKAKNCYRGQLFRPCWVSSARGMYEVMSWSTNHPPNADGVDLKWNSSPHFKFGYEFHLRSSPSAFVAWSVNQLIFSLLATPCWQDPTRSKQLSTVKILCFQFGLYVSSGVSMEGSRGPSYFGWKKEEMTEGRKASGASKSKHPPPPTISSRSGFTTNVVVPLSFPRLVVISLASLLRFQSFYFWMMRPFTDPT